MPGKGAEGLNFRGETAPERGWLVTRPPGEWCRVAAGGRGSGMWRLRPAGSWLEPRGLFRVAPRCHVHFLGRHLGALEAGPSPPGAASLRCTDPGGHRGPDRVLAFGELSVQMGPGWPGSTADLSPSPAWVRVGSPPHPATSAGQGPEQLKPLVPNWLVVLKTNCDQPGCHFYLIKHHFYRSRSPGAVIYLASAFHIMAHSS